MVSELNYPLLNFEVVKSAKFFFFSLFYFGWMTSRPRGLAVSEPACEYERLGFVSPHRLGKKL